MAGRDAQREARRDALAQLLDGLVDGDARQQLLAGLRGKAWGGGGVDPPAPPPMGFPGFSVGPGSWRGATTAVGHAVRNDGSSALWVGLPATTLLHQQPPLNWQGLDCLKVKR